MITIEDKSLNFGLLLTKKYFAIIKAIQDVTDEFYITGSIALSLLGIIRRPINDIDIVVSSKEVFNLLYETFGGVFYQNYNEEVCSTEDYIPKHLRFTIANIPVCVFFMQYESAQEVQVYGEKYFISDPEHIISAKFNYVNQIINDGVTEDSAKRLKKNIADIQDYFVYLRK